MAQQFPEVEQRTQDFLVALTDSVKEERWVEQPDGRQTKQSVINYKKLWYKLQNVSSAYFGEYAYQLEEFVNKAADAYNNMASECADILSEQILRKVRSHYLGIDAKSSETILDNHNNQKNLVHLLNKSEMTKKFIVKDEIAKAGVLGFLGGNKEPGE